MNEETYFSNPEEHFFIKGSPKEITAEHEVDFKLNGRKLRDWIMESIREGNYQKVTKVLEFEDKSQENSGSKNLFRLETNGNNFFYIEKQYYKLFKSNKYDLYIPDYYHKSRLLLVVDSNTPLEVDSVIGGICGFRYER